MLDCNGIECKIISFVFTVVFSFYDRDSFCGGKKFYNNLCTCKNFIDSICEE